MDEKSIDNIIDVVKDENSPKKDEIKKQSEKHEKILMWVFILCGVVLAGILSFYFYNQSLNRFDDEGFKYDIIKGEDVTFYHTSFLIYDKSNPINYNVYLRNDPRDLQKINFIGEMNRKEMLVINNSDEFNCEGDGVIAIANMAQILKAVKIKSIADQNATCDELGRYSIADLQNGDKTYIEQYGPSCYKIYINDCEILAGTERYIVEVLKDSNVLNMTKN